MPNELSGYFRDAETGLDYADQRYEQPGLGRFLTADPLSVSTTATDPGSWNRYSYVTDDPVNSTDPDGLSTVFINDSDPAFCNWDYFGEILGSRLNCSPAVHPKVGSKTPTPGICNSAILQPQYLSIFSQMGQDLGVDPTFIMALSVQESGWKLSHVTETDAASGGRPLNNLFGIAPGGGNNNKAFDTVQDSAKYWEQIFGPALANHPTTIQGFLSDLQSRPEGAYNSANPDWATSIQGGTWTVDHGQYAHKGDYTIGSYQSLINALAKCNITLP